MELTPAQKLTLKAAVEADATANGFLVNGDLSGLADYLNQLTATIVWKTLVTEPEVMLNGFDWPRVDNLSVGKARIWDWMFRSIGAINPSKPNIRAGIDATWVGTPADLAVRAAVYVHCKRPASRVEAVFATGTGTEAVPATMATEGPLLFGDLIGPPFQS
jgi:hypothetical protein